MSRHTATLVPRALRRETREIPANRRGRESDAGSALSRNLDTAKALDTLEQTRGSRTPC